MRKNIFSWKSLAGLALLFGLTMGLSSCEQVELPSNPSDPTETPEEPGVKPGEGDYDHVIVAYVPSDITAALKKITFKTDAEGDAAKGTNILVKSAELKVTATDNKIEIPAVTDAVINITFSDKFKEIKAALTITDEALDYVNLTFASDQLSLNFDMWASTVTLNSTGSLVIPELNSTLNYYGVYNSGNQTFGKRALTLGNGITVQTIDPKRGLVVVGEDAEVEALIVYDNSVYGYDYGIVNRDLTTPDYQGNHYYSYTYRNLRTAENAVNYLNSVKVKKVANGATYIRPQSKETPIENVTIEDGATVYIVYGAREEDPDEKNYFYYTYINNIVGLGTGSAVVSLYWPEYAFWGVEKVSNVTINNSYYGTNWIKFYTNIESCTVESFEYVYFASITQEVKKTTFKDAKQVTFNVDATNGATAYKFNYNECTFPAGCLLGVNDFETAHPILDANGNVVVYWIWHYAEYEKTADGKDWLKDANGNYVKKTDANGNVVWSESKDFNDIPLPARLEGQVYYHMAQGLETDDRISDMTITIGLTGSKVGDKTITKDYENLNVYTPLNWQDVRPASKYNAEFLYKYEIGGTLYRRTYDSTWGKYVFVTTN